MYLFINVCYIVIRVTNRIKFSVQLKNASEKNERKKKRRDWTSVENMLRSDHPLLYETTNFSVLYFFHRRLEKTPEQESEYMWPCVVVNWYLLLSSFANVTFVWCKSEIIQMVVFLTFVLTFDCMMNWMALFGLHFSATHSLVSSFIFDR